MAYSDTLLNCGQVCIGDEGNVNERTGEQVQG